MQNKLKAANIEAVPTDKLIEIMHSSPNDYVGKKGREHSIVFFHTFLQTYNLAREELLGRYISRPDTDIQGNMFSEEQEKLRWQKWKQELASIRYQDSYLKKLEKEEIDNFSQMYFYTLNLIGDLNSSENIKIENFPDEDRKSTRLNSSH